MARQWREGELGSIALVGGGFILVSLSYGGYVLGSLIGRYFGHQNTGAIIGLIAGTIIGFYDFIRIAVRVMNRQPTPSKEQQRIAQENWEKTEKKNIEEGVRDENHE